MSVSVLAEWLNRLAVSCITLAVVAVPLGKAVESAALLLFVVTAAASAVIYVRHSRHQPEFWWRMILVPLLWTVTAAQIHSSYTILTFLLTVGTAERISALQHFMATIFSSPEQSTSFIIHTIALPLAAAVHAASNREISKNVKLAVIAGSMLSAPIDFPLVPFAYFIWWLNPFRRAATSSGSRRT